MFTLPAGQAYPLVTIITATYHSAATVKDTLTSVALQDYPRIEHIIVDGLSKDTTLDVVSRYPHVTKVISEKDSGIYDAMNKGIRSSAGDIVGILNSDDFYVSSTVISEVVEKMLMDETDALYADLVYVHHQHTSHVIRHWKAGVFERNSFLKGWMPPHPTFFVRRSVYDRFGLFNTALISAADYELMLRFLFKEKVSVSYLPRVIVKMRAGGQSNASLINRIRANREDRQAWSVNGLKPYFYTTWLKPVRKLAQFIIKPKLQQ